MRFFLNVLPALVALAILFLVQSCSSADRQKNLVVKGSDTEVNLVLSLAEAYMKRDSTVSISVTGGGSGTGIAALINGETDIANASRPLKEEERSLARSRGVDPVSIVIAVDALAIITNEQLNVDSIGLDELAGIYTGRIENWSALGGPDQAVSLYGRQSNSGTFVFFRDSVLRDDYTQQLKQMNGNAQIVEAVRNDPYGIGYVGLGYVVNKEDEVASGISVLSVSNPATGEMISPLKRQNIRSGAYPLVRPLYQYTDGTPAGVLRDFIQFALGEEGQAIVRQTGFYAITPKYKEHNRQALEHHEPAREEAD